MGASTQRIERGSQATPLAEDFLAALQGHIAAGSLGEGFGGLQRDAGSAIRQFVNSGGPNTAGMLDADLTGLLDALSTVNARNTDRQAMDLREQFGAAGNRFSTGLSVGEGILRSDSLDNLNARLAELGNRTLGIQQRAREFDVGSQLQAIGSMFGMGTQSLAPFLQMAGMGILPEEIVQRPGLLGQLGGTILGLGGAALGNPVLGPAILGGLGIPGVGGGGKVLTKETR